MRFLIVDANYPAFLDSVYSAEPSLAHAPYVAQRARIRSELFGEVNFQVDALRDLGHEADSIIVNAHAAQEAWAREHGFRQRGRRWAFSRRLGVVPWPARKRPTVAWDIVLAQVRAFRPDVVYVGILDSMPPEIVDQMRPHARLVVAQIAAELPSWRLDGYDIVLSSIPGLVDHFRERGVTSEWVPLAFEPRVLEAVHPTDRDIEVSFVGSFSRVHRARLEVVEAVAKVSPLQTWTPHSSAIDPHSATARTLRGAAFGRAMYTILARSRITINNHEGIAGPDANNLRLYEATGMGALLVTDERRNLGELFERGEEVICYRSPMEAAELVRHFLDHPAEASRIAASGQSRTLRDHTWSARMAMTVELLRARL